MTGMMRHRGQPLLVLGGLLIGWFGIRVSYLELVPEFPVEASGQVLPGLPPTRAQPLAMRSEAEVEEIRMPSTKVPIGQTSGFRSAISRPLASIRAGGNHRAGLTERMISHPLASPVQVEGESPFVPNRGLPAAPYPVAHAPVDSSRWSADGWVLLRDDTITPIQSGLPSYGRSQAGAVFRYRLSTWNGRNLQAHVRASTAISAPHERELAAGLSARILPRIPLRIAAEARVGEQRGEIRVRPAAYAVTELPPIDLPAGGRGEVYLQGGYVGGRDATAFIDGQAKIQRPVVGRREASLSAGAGAWGGAQEGVTRFDAGPTATLTFRLGRTRARLAADYRFRVLGDAEPKNGPALTLSASF